MDCRVGVLSISKVRMLESSKQLSPAFSFADLKNAYHLANLSLGIHQDVCVGSAQLRQAASTFQ